MSFRRRSAGLGAAQGENIPIRGVRASPVDGRPTTSTGTPSLDSLLAGHAGLVLGTSLLLEESGTTDFGGSLLRYYAAEGIVQGHHVHVMGMHESWARDLPGLADEVHGGEQVLVSENKMKIAWRYERLGDFGSGARDPKDRIKPLSLDDEKDAVPFCHKFDLTKRLILPSPALIHYCPLSRFQPFQGPENYVMEKSPFMIFLSHLMKEMEASPCKTLHRVVIPNLLAPTIYPAHASQADHLLQFLHGLKALLRRFSKQMTALITFPISLYPRSSGLSRWVELLSDGVLELAPFRSTALLPKDSTSTKSRDEEAPQGMLKIHRLAVFHEKGGGGGEASKFSDDYAFTLRRREGLVIRPYSLPPAEGDSESQQSSLAGEGGKKTLNSDIEF